jgi:GMP synthase-like glutamine amidotransferase
MMRIHVVQHVPFEGPGMIGEWAEEQGHDLSIGLALTEEYPEPHDIDFLVVMGGPMDADDEDTSPWLVAEKHFIASAIASGRLVLGVCLGSQIIAEVIGGRVKRAPEREIGWYSVRLTEDGANEPLFDRWPDEAIVGHWHGDTFDLPLGLEPAISSEVTPNQAFVYDHRVVGLQFHLEWDEETLAALFEHCSEDLDDGGPTTMSEEEFAEQMDERIPACRELLFGLLDDMADVGPRADEASER